MIMATGQSTIEHKQWGRIIITRNPRARRIIMRVRPDAILMTVPEYAKEADIERALTECGARLKARQQQSQQQTIDKGFSINTEYFRLVIKESCFNKVRLTGSTNGYVIEVPQNTDFTSADTQQMLRTAIKGAAKHCAAKVLPQRLKELAERTGFKYKRCTVRDVRSRWGSCSTSGTISLNTQLILLPARLIDYVLLHELCHTVEMNHSDRFWALMDKVTAPAKARTLRAELKKNRMLF